MRDDDDDDRILTSKRRGNWMAIYSGTRLSLSLVHIPSPVTMHNEAVYRIFSYIFSMLVKIAS